MLLGGSPVHCILCIFLVNLHIFTEKENDKQIYGIFLRLNGRGNLSIQSFSAVIVLFSVYQKNSDNGHIHLKHHQAYAYK